MNKELDKDTQKIDSEGKALEGLIQHEGWALAKAKLISRVANLLSIDQVDIMNTTPDMIIAAITAKKTASTILLDWIKEVEGTANQHKGNAELIEQTVSDFVIREEIN